MKNTTRLAVTLIGLGLGAAFAAHGQMRTVSVARSGTSGGVIDARWKESFDAFAAADRDKAPKPGGVLFVGSSSIRLWNDLETSFEREPVVVKRGFGGSRMADCAAYVQQLVLPYKPRLIVVYAGDNDLAEGRTPEQVRESFGEFVEQVRTELPDTRIAYISIKPSPLRAELMQEALKTNALIKAYTASDARLDFIDIYAKMLGDDGQPRADLFLEDRLHLNAKGYAVWKQAVGEHLGTRAAATAAASAGEIKVPVKEQAAGAPAAPSTVSVGS